MSNNFKVFDTMMEGVQVIGKDWKYLYLNDIAVKHSKLKIVDLLNHTPQEIYPGIEKTEMFQALKNVMESRKPKNMFNKFDYPDGSFGHFNLYIEPIEEGILIQSFDITKQKLDEEKLIKMNQLLEKQNKIVIEQSESLNRLLQEKNATITKMQEEKDFTDLLFQYSTEGILLINEMGNIIRMNSNTDKMFGYEEGELHLKKVEMLLPQNLANIHQSHRKKFNENPLPRAMGTGINLLAKRKDNSEFPVEISLSPFRRNGELFIIVFVVDITVRKKNEDDIKKRKQDLLEKNLELEKQTEILSKSLEEKIMLIREIHHRVKNNLQIIISLIHLQSNQFMDNTTKEVFQSFENRIGTMALIHHLLYAKGSSTTLNLEDFVNVFGHYIIDNARMENLKLDVDVKLTQKTVNIDTAISFGLLLNEIFTNSVKHGCKKENECKISLQLKDDGQSNFILTMGDNGFGIPKEVLNEDKIFLGLSLIDDLVNQLEGKYQRSSNENGTIYTINFKEINTDQCAIPNNS